MPFDKLTAEERRLRRISNTPQGGAIEDNAADDALMVNQGVLCLTGSYVAFEGQR
ncbi:hypothetical protein ACFL0H_02460 [Thermodesulfobacteriota bacterium]